MGCNFMSKLYSNTRDRIYQQEIHSYLEEICDPVSGPQEALVDISGYPDPLCRYWFWVLPFALAFHVVETPCACSFKEVGLAVTNPAEDSVNGS